MAFARYRGDHLEPSFAFRVTGGDGPVLPFGVYDGAVSRRIEVVCLPNGAWRRVNPFAAIYLAAVRRRIGPWFDVRISPEEWREVRRRAPWLRKARAGALTALEERLGRSAELVEELQDDAVMLCDPRIAEGLYAMTSRAYRVL